MSLTRVASTYFSALILLSLVGCSKPEAAAPPVEEPVASAPKAAMSSPTGTAAKAASEQIRFAAGASSATLKGSVVRGDRKTYRLNAIKKQTMTATITSTEKNAVFDLIGPDGKTIKAEATTVKEALPATGDYQLVVGGTRGNASYSLTIEVK
jgi:hypothetical protein